MKVALVTGGAGFLGSQLTRALVERAWHVRILDNFTEGIQANLWPFADRVEVVTALDTLLDGTRASAELGFTPQVDLTRGLARCLNYQPASRLPAPRGLWTSASSGS